MPQASGHATATLQTVVDHLRWASSRLARAGLSFGHGSDNAADEAWYLLRHVLQLPNEIPEAWWQARLLPEEADAVVALIEQRVASRKPAAYLTGEAFFCGLRFEVDERVIVPRSPMAELIEAGFAPWLCEAPRRVLDLCAGSGCIAIACAYAFEAAEVTAVELDEGAMAVLRRNRALHGLDGDPPRLRALQGDLFAPVAGERFDLIVTNPPYVAAEEWAALPEEYHREPRLALVSGDDGMDLVERLLREAPEHLNEGGTLVCEIGASGAAFDARFPAFPAIWPDLERGGEGIFVITRQALVDWQAARQAPQES